MNIPAVYPASPAPPEYKKYNVGSVLRLLGNDILIEDVTVDGYSGIAVVVQGDRVRIVNPTIRNPQAYVPAGIFGPGEIVANGAGIRVYQGAGFRCYGGSIDSGGDAALQFSGDRTVPGDISDGLYQGVHCTSTDGRLILVGSTNPAITDVRFVGITGTTSGKGNCIKVQNQPRTGTGKPISRVTFRDIAVSHGDISAPAIGIENALTDGTLVSDILFENLSITTPSNVAFVTFAAADPSLRPIRRVSWRTGSIVDPLQGSDSPAISLSQLDGGVFSNIRVAAGRNKAAVTCGEAIDEYPTVAGCSNVVLADFAVTGVADGVPGVRFAAATNCALVRGRIAEAAGAQGVAVKFAPTSARCSVDGTDLSGVTSLNKVQAAGGVAPRVRDLFGFDLTLIPPLGTIRRWPASRVAGQAAPPRPPPRLLRSAPSLVTPTGIEPVFSP